MYFSRFRLTVLASAIIIPLLLLLARSYMFENREYIVYENGLPLHVEGHYSTIADVIKAAGVTLRPEDIVHPDRDQIPDPKSPISVVRARKIVLTFQRDSTYPEIAGEDSRTIWSQQDHLASFLTETGEVIQPGDQILADNKLVSEQEFADTPLVGQVEIVRRKEITIRENKQESTLVTSARSVGEALLEAGIRLTAADAVKPPLRNWLSSGSVVEVQRSIPLTVKIDGQVVRAHTHHREVMSVMEELGITLEGQDYTVPDLAASLEPQDQIEVFRVREEYEFSDEIIPFDSVIQLTIELEIDQIAVIQQGVPGILRQRTLVQSENGVEISRFPAGESIAQQPINEVIGYGTNIVVRTVDTPDGILEYWRVVPMRVTAYTAATSGKERSHPAYGITASGVPAGFGVVSVDPAIVPFRSYVYVPGYGKGFAGDTGGGVKGRFIDLGYDEGQIVTWNGYVDVYYLTPVPPADQINYTLPTSLP
jgi:uncharacterized protein YabE (DUF348 family)/3D (Asp-Asp-Asp) domain-containing protein